ncbi:MAG: hypothetical protein ACJ8DC_10955 [Gemmatimonadales bacterium]
MWHRHVTLLGGIVLGASSLGCHTWRTQEAAPRQVMEQHPTSVRVHQLDGTRYVLRKPAVIEDTLTGLRAGTRAKIPLNSVQGLALRRFSTGRTTMLVLGIPAGLFGVALVGCATSNCGY